jgi:hypothetical protein
MEKIFFSLVNFYTVIILFYGAVNRNAIIAALNSKNNCINYLNSGSFRHTNASTNKTSVNNGIPLVINIINNNLA